ncbi:MAG: hypothetical protein H6699_07915 [Myxococcales bacterium]|nr:hypothetical protein [Myxococcales bacterium]
MRDALDIDEGDILTREAWLQAERNLRALGVFSVATVVTTWRFEPDCVELLVATRDRWSLLFNTVVTSNGSAVSDFTFGVSEANLFGTGNYLALTTSRGLGSWRVGPTLYAPRLGGRASACTKRSTSTSTGRSAASRAWRPRRALRADSRSPGSASPGARSSTTPTRCGADTPAPSSTRGSTATSGSTSATASPRPARRARSRASGAPTFATACRPGSSSRTVRSAPSRAIRLSLPRRCGPTPRHASPVAERRVGPTITYSIFQSRYLRLVELDTYGVGEEVRRGQGASATISYMEPGLGADERRADASVGYDVLVAMGDDAFISGAAGLGLRLRSEATDRCRARRCGS